VDGLVRVRRRAVGAWRAPVGRRVVGRSGPLDGDQIDDAVVAVAATLARDVVVVVSGPVLNRGGDGGSQGTDARPFLVEAAFEAGDFGLELVADGLERGDVVAHRLVLLVGETSPL